MAILIKMSPDVYHTICRSLLIQQDNLQRDLNNSVLLSTEAKRVEYHIERINKALSQLESIDHEPN